MVPFPRPKAELSLFPLYNSKDQLTKYQSPLNGLAIPQPGPRRRTVVDWGNLSGTRDLNCTRSTGGCPCPPQFFSPSPPYWP